MVSYVSGVARCLRRCLVVPELSMSPELETLDQLLGGAMPLATIRGLYRDDQQFARSIYALLLNGDVRLLTHDGVEIPPWRWRELFVEGGAFREMAEARLAITEQGGRRIS